MARTKEFDITEVLEKAMEVFWQKGYYRTTLKDIQEVTGLHKGSLYGTFRNKRNLFKMALKYYNRRRQDVMLHTGQPLGDLERFFNRLIEEGTSHGKSLRGCLVMNTSMELPREDDELKELVVSILKDYEDYFFQAVQEGQKEGKITSEIDPRQSAQILLGAAFSIRGLAKSRPERELLTNIARHALSHLRQGAKSGEN